MNVAITTRRFLDLSQGWVKYSGALPVVLLLVVACQDATRSITQAATDEPAATPGRPEGGLVVSAFYVDAEAATYTVRHVKRLLADDAWTQRQAGFRGISPDSIHRELQGRLTEAEQYLVDKAATAGVGVSEYRQALERRMRRVQLAERYDILLPSSLEAQAGEILQTAGAGVCERGPQFESWNLDATLTVMGDDVVATFSAIHRTDRPADQGLDLLWSHNQQGPPSGRANPSRRQLSICRDYATAAHNVVWDRCAASSPALVSARSIHTTSDIRYGGRTFRTRGSQASDRTSFNHNRCSTGGGGIDTPPPYTPDPLCASGYRASTGDCCDSMVNIRGVKWCVIVN